ncbi:carboxypeptidase regulatory-like domain-containing protein [Gillisia sp. Hel_I_29]|uniref:carboxypeptidase regulatory-like domain-containing protein n=1 Tax=Gillisia sp. Hel_I_29 TaxID=1249975 RepID=UPI000551B8E1|nr:carboxypeptidase regulatory-like domain-containing protein [Gillisia sp. Hel_I_29]
MKFIKPLILLLLLISAVGCSEDTIGAFGNGTITGRVVKDGSNEPIENVKISTNPASTTVFSDADGNFILKDVPEGEYSVQAQKDGLLTKFEGATVRQSAEVNVIFELKPQTANNRQPSAPEAIFPEDNATNVDVSLQFAWTSTDPEGDDLTYELELRNDINNSVLKFQDIQDTTYTVNGLQNGLKYFWQIKVTDSVNDPVLSKVYSFETSQFPKTRYYYVRKVSGNNVIFSSDGAGGEYQLTSSSVNSFRPRKNNATNKVAFLRTVGGQTQLFTMDPDGSRQTQITNNIPVNGFNLEKIGYSWIDDGTALVYPNFSKLYKININGGGNELIYETPNLKFISGVAVNEVNKFITLLTTNVNGYDGSVFTIDYTGNKRTTILDNQKGAIGGLDISVDGKTLLYSKDISEFENGNYRQLDAHIFSYNFSTGRTIDLSQGKPSGFNDLDPRFSPNEASIIFTSTSNDGVSPINIYMVGVNDMNAESQRLELFQNAFMPDWE